MVNRPNQPEWKPATKAEETMDKRYRPLSRRRRMELAMKAVLNEGLTHADAARRFGVTRQQLGLRLGELRDEALKLEANAAEVKDPVEAEAQHKLGEREVPPFEEFWRLYLSNQECPDCGVAHELPEFHKELMGLVTDPDRRRLLVNVAPYHAKSTVVTVWSTLYELCKNPNSRHLIVSKSQRLAEKFVYQIGRYLTDPAMYDRTPRNLIDDFGPFQDDTSQWNASQFYVCGRTSTEKDPSVSALGVGGHIYGVRADRIIFDDIADLENQKNPDRVAEMLRWCTQEAGTRVGRKSGRLIYVGTRVSSGDIYSNLSQLPGFESFRYPCILDEPTGKTLWQDHFPIESAIDMRDSMDPIQFQLVYQNVDTPGLGSSFPLDVVERCYEPTRIMGQYDPTWTLVAGMDPAGSGAKAGYTAMVLLGIDMETGTWHLVDLVNVKSMKAPQMKEQIFEWAEAYPIRELRVEVNGLQGQLTQYNEEFRNGLASRGVRIEPHITSKFNKWDPMFGVEALAPYFHNRAITLPYADVNSRKKTKELVDQLVSFPMGQVSDLVMAFWFASLAVRDIERQQRLPLFSDRKVPAHVRNRRRVLDFADDKVLLPSQARHRAGRDLPFGGGVEMVKLANMGGYISLPS